MRLLLQALKTPTRFTSGTSTMPVASLHPAQGQVDEPGHVGGGGGAEVDDPVRMLRRDLRPAQNRALEAHRVDEPAGVVAGRIGEDAAAVGLAQGLGALAVAEVGLHRCLRSDQVAGGEAEAGPGHHRARRAAR